MNNKEKIEDKKEYIEKTNNKEEEEIKKLMKINYLYPDVNDKELQYKIYKKREFYFHKIPERPNIDNYNDIKEYRDNICVRQFTLHEHQALLSNFINPNTPYKGILLFHGLGTGKCVLPETKVTINNKLMNIGDVWEIYKREIKIDKEKGEWSMITKDMKTLTLNNKYIIKHKIKRLYREEINSIIREIILKNGEKIKTTIIHKFMTKNGWTNNINTTDYIMTYNRGGIEYVRIESIKYEEYKGYVYDMEIEDTHNYVANNMICHNTCAGIAIAEKFKPIVQKYNTKIYILVSGPIIKKIWKTHLLKCTGETYLKYQDKSVYMDETEKQIQEKNSLNQALQYYKIISYRSFYKRVLGEKIVENKVVSGSKTKISYRKTDEGDFERDIAIDKIDNLNNTLIIIDEAHNLTGNAYGEALMYIIKKSYNLKIVLMSATPMKNLADDIVELINFIRPIEVPMERDKIFDGEKNHFMSLKPNGLDYFKNMASGYISHIRGADPLLFAKRNDKGIKPNEFMYIKVIPCKMLEFQHNTYDITVREIDDTLDRRSEAVANFVFPCITSDKRELIGCYGKDGLNSIKSHLKISSEIINKKIATDLLKIPEQLDLITISQNGKTITGKILKLQYLKYFSTKFYKALKKLNRLVWGKKGPKIAFIYSNLVKVGIELFQEILLQNGYLEYQKDKSLYQINADTVCYYCGKTYEEHKIQSTSEISRNKSETISISRISESSTEYEKKTSIPEHKFHPGTFISIVGKSNEEIAELIPDDKKDILDKVFNNINNKEGKYIKFLLGSKVMNEGVSLENVGEIHILDVYFNLGRIDQVVGRGIRSCSHHKLMNDENKFPLVDVYKYVITLNQKSLSTEEELYKKAEYKYLLIKKIERAMKEVAIDCPLNVYGNMFKEEYEKYKHCNEKGYELCPTICDYSKCNYKCNDIKLNTEYYDPQRYIYKKISRDNLDYSTFVDSLARNEIEYAKIKIKELYIDGTIYTIQHILKYVKDSYDDDKRELFDEFFVYKGLDEMIPITENDFNSFKDTVLDKNNKSGYLIYINKYYIFQPFDQNENVSMYYRTKNMNQLTQKISLHNYLKNTNEYKNYKSKNIQESDSIKETSLRDDTVIYNFDDIMDYYDERDEFKYVGIIDKEISRRKMKQIDEIKDVFKIREKRAKILEKKRGTGIPSLKGAVCATSKNKKYLERIAKHLDIDIKNIDTRTDICEIIKNKMLLLEKYSTKNNKLTYVIIPFNHPLYKFPYNLEDRIDYIIQQIKKKINIKLNISITSLKQNIINHSNKIEYPIYYIHIKNDSQLQKYTDVLTSFDFQLNNNEWLLIVD